MLRLPSFQTPAQLRPMCDLPVYRTARARDVGDEILVGARKEEESKAPHEWRGSMGVR